ncbi:Methyltransferase type 12 [Cellulosilyticum lentocellum DSM 5427]|uniref:Methyltransferase type 12 n=2 Tax=Cellulosilyticum lentocellum TaxID=29360 RepID=F2JT26_CELLD|nr:Methyltransferase type 12 [Cellulosilyticum lentocellum DSM 5427]
MHKIEEFLKSREDEFSSNYKKYGDSPRSLNVDAVKQFIGFNSLIQDINMNDRSILDIGCGLGDINRYFKFKGFNNYKYLGVDIVENFIKQGEKKYGTDDIKFIKGNFINDTYEQKFDYIIGNQIFYRKIRDMDTYIYIEQMIAKAFELCNKSVMFNFLSDRAEIQYEANFYANVEKIINFAYTLSKNIVIRNDYSPYEFSIVISKSNNINIRPTYFVEYLEKNQDIIKCLKDDIGRGIYENKR